LKFVQKKNLFHHQKIIKLDSFITLPFKYYYLVYFLPISVRKENLSRLSKINNINTFKIKKNITEPLTL